MTFLRLFLIRILFVTPGLFTNYIPIGFAGIRIAELDTDYELGNCEKWMRHGNVTLTIPIYIQDNSSHVWTCVSIPTISIFLIVYKILEIVLGNESRMIDTNITMTFVMEIYPNGYYIQCQIKIMDSYYTELVGGELETFNRDRKHIYFNEPGEHLPERLKIEETVKFNKAGPQHVFFVMEFSSESQNMTINNDNSLYRPIHIFQRLKNVSVSSNEMNTTSRVQCTAISEPPAHKFEWICRQKNWRANGSHLFITVPGVYNCECRAWNIINLVEYEGIWSGDIIVNSATDIDFWYEFIILVCCYLNLKWHFNDNMNFVT